MISHVHCSDNRSFIVINTAGRTKEVKRRIVCILRLGESLQDVILWYCVWVYEVKPVLDQASGFGKMGVF